MHLFSLDSHTLINLDLVQEIEFVAASESFDSDTLSIYFVAGGEPAAFRGKRARDAWDRLRSLTPIADQERFGRPGK